jgi:O-antigen ligase
MPPGIASIFFAVGIAGLFFLDRGLKSRVSNALWIPAAWLFIISSRPVSQWLGVSPTGDVASLYIEGSPVDRAIFAVLEIAALIVVLGRWRRVRPILTGNWVLGLFFLYAALSVCWSDYPFVTLKRWIKGIGDVTMVLIVLTEPSVAEALKRLITRVGFVLVPLSVLFIKYYPSLGRVLNLSWTMEPVGVATQKNGLGESCCIFGLGLLWRFRATYNDRKDPNRRRHLLALGAVLAMIVWLLWMCNSITSICAVSMACAAILLSTRPTFRQRPALVHLLVVAMLACTSYALFFQSSGSLLQGLGRSSTLTGRTDIWALVLSIPNNRLVGAGYETFWMGPRLLKLWDLFPGLKINEAHNGYIEMLLNLGWIGVALFGALIATGYRNVIVSYRRDPDIGGLRMAFFLATIITGLTEAAFRMTDPPWVVFLLATSAGRWMPRRRISQVVSSSQDLLESDKEPDAFRTGAPSRFELGTAGSEPPARPPEGRIHVY